MEVMGSITLGIEVGFVATLVMSIYQYPFFRRWGIMGVPEWHENAYISSWLFIHKLPGQLVYRGLIFHLINGVIPAIFFTWLMSSFGHMGPLLMIVGIVYGVLLWIFTLAPIHHPITGVKLREHPLGWAPIYVSVMGHAIYGLTLAVMLNLKLF